MKFFRKLFLILALVSAISIGAIGCSNDSELEKTGDEAADMMDDAADDVGDSLEDAGDKAEDVMD